MKSFLKKDILDFCEKFNIDTEIIEDIVVDELYCLLRNKKEKKEFKNLVKKYGYIEGE